MIISEKQIQMLIIILKDSISMISAGLFSVTHETRLKLLNQLIDQQSEELKVIE